MKQEAARQVDIFGVEHPVYRPNNEQQGLLFDPAEAREQTDPTPIEEEIERREGDGEKWTQTD